MSWAATGAQPSGEADRDKGCADSRFLISAEFTGHAFLEFKKKAYLRPMPQYTMLAVDLDGTALRNDKSLSPRTIDALVGAQRRGMRLIIASGRPPQGIAHVARALLLHRLGGFVLAYNGGELWQPLGEDVAQWRLIERHQLAYEAIETAYRMGKAAGMELLTYHEGRLLSEDIGNRYVGLSLRANRLKAQPVDSFLEATRALRLAKCMVVGDPQVLQSLERPLAASLLHRATVFRSEPYYMEIVPVGIDKGRGLARLLEEMGESPDRLIACGDAPNDIPMLCFAGLGVAMGNAQPPVKAAADSLCGTNEEDGVAQVAERFWPRE